MSDLVRNQAEWRQNVENRRTPLREALRERQRNEHHLGVQQKHRHSATAVVQTKKNDPLQEALIMRRLKKRKRDDMDNDATNPRDALDAQMVASTGGANAIVAAASTGTSDQLYGMLENASSNLTARGDAMHSSLNTKMHHEIVDVDLGREIGMMMRSNEMLDRLILHLEVIRGYGIGRAHGSGTG